MLRNWLNSFDFEHATEPERLAKISELLIGSKYDDEVKNNPSLHTYDKFYQVLINKKGVCIDFADTGHLLATLLGLKCAVVGDTVHACWIVQADAFRIWLKTELSTSLMIGEKLQNSEQDSLTISISVNTLNTNKSFLQHKDFL